MLVLGSSEFEESGELVQRSGRELPRGLHGIASRLCPAHPVGGRRAGLCGQLVEFGERAIDVVLLRADFDSESAMLPDRRRRLRSPGAPAPAFQRSTPASA